MHTVRLRPFWKRNDLFLLVEHLNYTSYTQGAASNNPKAQCQCAVGQRSHRLHLEIQVVSHFLRVSSSESRAGVIASSIVDEWMCDTFAFAQINKVTC